MEKIIVPILVTLTMVAALIVFIITSPYLFPRIKKKYKDEDNGD